MLAYRLSHDKSLLNSRSFCPICGKTLDWLSLIPVISWIALKGKCKFCLEKISILYPFIEILTVISIGLLFTIVTYPYLISYFIFFSALIITIRTDLETMQISRFASIFLIPLALVLSFFNLLPITFTQSIIGTIFGYILLFTIAKLFLYCTKKQGIGEGDIELLAFIGAFTGIYGVWISLLIGSILGSVFGIILILINKLNLRCKMPFGPFLAISSILYVLFQDQVLFLIFGI